MQADTVRAQYLTLLGGTRWQEFAVSSTAEPTGYHPLASFKVRGGCAVTHLPALDVAISYTALMHVGRDSL